MKSAAKRYTAKALPNGAPRHGVTWPVVMLTKRMGSFKRIIFLSRAEAEALRDALAAALRDFDPAKDLAADVAARPRAYTGPFPVRGATLADLGFCEGET